MYKAKLLGVAAMLAVSLTACSTGETSETAAIQETGTQAVQQTEPETENSAEVETEEEAPDSGIDAAAGMDAEETNGEDGNILIAYFSRVGNTDFAEDVDASSSASIIVDGETVKGNTELIAEMIQAQIGGDLFLIETAEKYPTDYNETVDLGQVEESENARPELASHVENMEDYDVVFVGYPNWWGDCPMAVYSFLEEYDFAGKTVIPFSTSGGSGLSGTVSSIQELLPDATVTEGFTVRDSGTLDAQSEVTEWLNSLSLFEEE